MYNGIHFRDLSEFEAFKDFQDLGGMLIEYSSERDSTNAFALYGKGDTLILLHEKAYNPENGSMARYIFQDAIQLNEVKKGYFIIYGQCLLDGQNDAYIVALMKVRKSKKGYFRKCAQAWRLNPITHFFEEIDPKMVICYDEGDGC